MTDLSKLSNAELLSMYAMPALTAQESGGRGNAVSSQGALGSTQMLPATAQAMAQRSGLPWRPDYMTSTAPEAIDYQQTLGRAYLQQGIEKTGNLSDGLRYYHGGPDRKQWGPKTQAYEHSVMGRMGQGQPAPDLSHMTDQQLMEAYHAGGQAAPPMPEAAPGAAPQPGAVPYPQLGPGVTVERDTPHPQAPPLQADQGLGFLKGVTAPVFNASGHLQRAIEGSAMGDSMASQGAGLRQALPKGLVDFIDNPQGYFDAQASKGVRPGKLGEFAGNVAGTAFIPGGPLAQGAVGGALLSDKKDLKGVAGDATLGAVASRLGAAGSDALQIGARKLLSKAPKIMSVPELEAAVKAAYGKVDASGFKIPTPDMHGLADAVQGLVRQKGGPKAAKIYGDSDAFAARLKELATQKGGVKVSMLDDLRSDIYDALIKPGGKEAGIGKAIRSQIDGLIDSVPNGDVKAARELYTRLSKARTVSKVLDSADLRKSAAYSGSNTDNTIRQQMRPLVDPTSGKRINNATPDEQKALRRVVEGTTGQNLARLVGQGADPRKLLGKLSGLGAIGAAPGTGMMSLLLPAAGLTATTISNRASQKNVQALADLIAVGGSKEALKKVPTQVSHLAEVLLSKGVRPAAVAAAVPALVAARKPETPKARPAK